MKLVGAMYQDEQPEENVGCKLAICALCVRNDLRISHQKEKAYNVRSRVWRSVLHVMDLLLVYSVYVQCKDRCKPI